MSDEQRLEELRRWADEQVPTAVPWVRDRVRLLLALVADLQQIIDGLAARVAAQSELLGRKAERREM